MAVLPWLVSNWFDLLQSIGIVAGLLFTGVSLKTDAQVRRVQNLLKVTEQHRDLWSRLYDEPELRRVIEEHPDLNGKPVTYEEELFVLSVVLHLNSVYRAIESGMYASPEQLTEDVRRFFSKPIPQKVWKNVSGLQDKVFVRFVNENVSQLTV